MNCCFNGLTTVNIELTTRCNKNCWMCGRRKIEREYPEIAIEYGDMEFELVKSIAQQLPENIVVQFHDNGEPLLYEQFGEAVRLFNRQIRCMDTNGKLLVKKAGEIIDNLDTLTISTFEKDEEAEEQYKLIEEFLKIKKNRKPNVIIRCLGSMDLDRYKKLGCIIATRVLHSPMGSFKYKKNPTIPEIGICLDLLNHMVIKRDGKVSLCVRFDPRGLGVIGDCTKNPLVDIWNSPIRKERLKYHIEGKRKKIPLCSSCEFWGVPTGY
ncbi:SPASM domain-containing protein [bacterium]|nr:SPASM domain-containing protein [bacterium]